MTAILSIDTEYGYAGDVQSPRNFVPVLFVSVNVVTGERHHFWGRDAGLASFIEKHRDDVFVSHNLLAEAKYLLQLGITLPRTWYDSMLAFRYDSNAEHVSKYGLLEAAVKLRLPTHVTKAEKEELQSWIGTLRFNPRSAQDRDRILAYCTGDCECAANIYRCLAGRAPPVPSLWMTYATRFGLELARMELRGLPVDVARLRRLQDRRDLVIDRVVSEINHVYPVFDNSRLNKSRLLYWCAAHGIGWPLSRSPRTGLRQRSFEDDVFKTMGLQHSFLEDVRQANKTITRLNNRDLPIDFESGRHYPGNIPFAQKTGRTSPKGSVFSAAKWMRFLVSPSTPEHVLISADYKAQEFLIAGYLADDDAMVASYVTGDPHMHLAILAGAAPEGATEETHPEARKLYKTINLAVLYGQTAHGISQKTGRHLREARALLAQHKRAYPGYWAWVERYTQSAFSKGRALTRGGWPRKVKRNDNPRSVANHAIQGTAADVMRVSVINLGQNSTPLLAVIHDGFVFECRRDQLALTQRAIDDALERAVQQVLPGAPLRWKTKEFTERYEDGDGEPLWRLVREVLDADNMLPDGACGVLHLGA
jgi:DNA polymerase I-like protein with 3'-5' exonuclease and polymerase domains